ncbi:hypothetical protein [Flavobacterium haoranii]|uniref:Uncharacterized protein n=1 Tax=Flavobacterium haoranii TaxID=683124 RepID=A0A1M6F1L1_9FLAO|nr:hypothetical protein [Flavobacterium haoranii]SHI91608.1 hypothetical protein SAMN05444337_1103 [Flavobacterium haoranii]
MKKIVPFILILIALQSFQCENDNQNDVITEEMLNNKRTEITNYIGQFSCSATSTCNFIALGSKPCGGPREYLVYSNNVDQNELQQLVSEYYTMDSTRNVQTNAISDCSIVMPPENINCIDGVCTIIN